MGAADADDALPAFFVFPTSVYAQILEEAGPMPNARAAVAASDSAARRGSGVVVHKRARQPVLKRQTDSGINLDGESSGPNIDERGGTLRSSLAESGSRPVPSSSNTAYSQRLPASLFSNNHHTAVAKRVLQRQLLARSSKSGITPAATSQSRSLTRRSTPSINCGRQMGCATVEKESDAFVSVTGKKYNFRDDDDLGIDQLHHEHHKERERECHKSFSPLLFDGSYEEPAPVAGYIHNFTDLPPQPPSRPATKHGVLREAVIDFAGSGGDKFRQMDPLLRSILSLPSGFPISRPQTCPDALDGPKKQISRHQFTPVPSFSSAESTDVEDNATAAAVPSARVSFRMPKTATRKKSWKRERLKSVGTIVAKKRRKKYTSVGADSATQISNALDDDYEDIETTFLKDVRCLNDGETDDATGDDSDENEEDECENSDGDGQSKRTKAALSSSRKQHKMHGSEMLDNLVSDLDLHDINIEPWTETTPDTLITSFLSAGRPATHIHQPPEPIQIPAEMMPVPTLGAVMTAAGRARCAALANPAPFVESRARVGRKDTGGAEDPTGDDVIDLKGVAKVEGDGKNSSIFIFIKPNAVESAPSCAVEKKGRGESRDAFFSKDSSEYGHWKKRPQASAMSNRRTGPHTANSTRATSGRAASSRGRQQRPAGPLNDRATSGGRRPRPDEGPAERAVVVPPASEEAIHERVIATLSMRELRKFFPPIKQQQSLDGSGGIDGGARPPKVVRSTFIDNGRPVRRFGLQPKTPSSPVGPLGGAGSGKIARSSEKTGRLRGAKLVGGLFDAGRTEVDGTRPSYHHPLVTPDGDLVVNTRKQTTASGLSYTTHTYNSIIQLPTLNDAAGGGGDSRGDSKDHGSSKLTLPKLEQGDESQSPARPAQHSRGGNGGSGTDGNGKARSAVVGNASMVKHRPDGLQLSLSSSLSHMRPLRPDWLDNGHGVPFLPSGVGVDGKILSNALWRVFHQRKG